MNIYKVITATGGGIFLIEKEKYVVAESFESVSLENPNAHTISIFARDVTVVSRQNRQPKTDNQK